ncbi:MAG: hypothetical protein IKU32_04040 [Clostridia bacterium]|nr:hypothetical protein [Clostridia bacterium]
MAYAGNPGAHTVSVLVAVLLIVPGPSIVSVPLFSIRAVVPAKSVVKDKVYPPRFKVTLTPAGIISVLFSAILPPKVILLSLWTAVFRSASVVTVTSAAIAKLDTDSTIASTRIKVKNFSLQVKFLSK